MRKYFLVLLFLSSLLVRAHRVEMNYSRVINQFGITVTEVDYGLKETTVHINVKNLQSNDRFMYFNGGGYIYTSTNPKGVKCLRNTMGGLYSLFFKPYENYSYIMTFPSSELKPGDVFDLAITSNVTLKNIVRNMTLDELNESMLSWSQYYGARKKHRMTYKNVDEIKSAIEEDVSAWQIKGEFESTLAWQQRVNDRTRQQYISELTSKYTSQYNKELEIVKNEQNEIAKEYKGYRQRLMNEYYQSKINIAESNFLSSKFELQPYDADNETFLIHNVDYGDILLPVPISEAPDFKKNWEKIRNAINVEFIPNGDDVALNKVTFNNGFHRYVYDSHTVANYAITDIDYNFAPVEIAELDISEVNSNDIPEISNSVSSSLLSSDQSSSILAKNVVNPSKNHVTASERSDVDFSIPQRNEVSNSTTFAVIIANEKYNNVYNVSYAENDGNVLSKYFVKALGLPEDHVKIYNNATYGNMVSALKHIDNLALAFGEKLNIILYYAGHGVPDEKTKQCMLLPVDGDATMPETCYSVDKLYSSLSDLNAKSVVVFMDACFSGSVRGDGMLFASRGVRIKSNKTTPRGKMVILTASQGDETAFPYEKEQHGMFTYYILKKLQEEKGNVTLGELCDYVVENVKRQSVVTNGKIQTPEVLYSQDVVNEWRNWNLNE